MNVLRAMLISGPEPALLPCRQARHLAPGDHPAAEGVRRVIESPAVQPRLTTMSALFKGNRVDIHPPVTRGPQLDPDRQPVGLRRIPELAEDYQAAAEVTGIDSKVKVAMLAGLPANQRGHAPSPAHPMAHPASSSVSKTWITSSASIHPR